MFGRSSVTAGARQLSDRSGERLLVQVALAVAFITSVACQIVLGWVIWDIVTR